MTEARAFLNRLLSQPKLVLSTPGCRRLPIGISKLCPAAPGESAIPSSTVVQPRPGCELVATNSASLSSGLSFSWLASCSSGAWGGEEGQVFSTCNKSDYWLDFLIPDKILSWPHGLHYTRAIYCFVLPAMNWQGRAGQGRGAQPEGSHNSPLSLCAKIPYWLFYKMQI